MDGRAGQAPLSQIGVFELVYSFKSKKGNLPDHLWQDLLPKASLRVGQSVVRNILRLASFYAKIK